jgi:hypothetical protein
MNAKEQKIKEAYGEYYDVALNLCDENGWIKSKDYYTFFDQSIKNCRSTRN